MPTLLRWKGHRFYFWAREPNEPPHIHVDKDNKTVKIWLSSLEVAYNDGFAGHEVTKILKVAGQHRDTFLRAWHDFFV